MSTGKSNLLGFSFSVDFRRPADQVKELLRSGIRSVFDVRPGVRGWVSGPLFCLWLSPYWTMGPMAVGYVSKRGKSCTVTGIAGFDVVPGIMLVAASFAIPVVLALSGRSSFEVTLLALVGCPVAAASLLWTRTSFHHEADPIVRFIETLGAPRQKASRLGLEQPLRSLTIAINGGPEKEMSSIQELGDAFQGLKPDEFLILAASAEHYMQTLRIIDEFIVEKREGGKARHYRAKYADGRRGHASPEGPTLSAEDAQGLIVAYAMARPIPSFAAWEKVRT